MKTIKRWEQRRKDWIRANPEYKCWFNMRTRCNNPKSDRYKFYGGRGISVCQRWGRYSNFIEDMGRMPGEGFTIERIDNDGNYEPANCKWASRRQQARNRRSTKWVTIGAETMSLAEAVEKYGVSYGAVQRRIDKGWTAEMAIMTPIKPSHRRAA